MLEHVISRSPRKGTNSDPPLHVCVSIFRRIPATIRGIPVAQCLQKRWTLNWKMVTFRLIFSIEFPTRSGVGGSRDARISRYSYHKIAVRSFVGIAFLPHSVRSKFPVFNRYLWTTCDFCRFAGKILFKNK